MVKISSPIRDGDVELLEQFAGEAILERLIAIALPAGKLPQASQVDTFLPPGDEELPVDFDDRCGDDDDGHRPGVNGKVRQPFAIGHTRHFGLRATQIIAPKSISAWLKSNTCR